MADSAWRARLVPTERGLQLRFSEPIERLDMTKEIARRLGSLLLVASEGRQPKTSKRKRGGR